jgi:hypothetical protein
MDLQTYLDNAMIANREERMKTSDQLTLGEIILKIEPILKKQEMIKEKYKHEAAVVFDFEYLYPIDIDSWRGIYRELALGFESGDNKMTVVDFYKMIKDCVGKTFTGYKGGDFVMGKNTPVWVANYGNSGNTAVIDIIDNEYEVVIITGYRET